MLTSRSAFRMFDRLSPSKPVVAAAKPVTAGLSVEEEGVCPYCNGKMRQTFSGPHQVWLCDYDRHVAPIRDEDS